MSNITSSSHPTCCWNCISLYSLLFANRLHDETLPSKSTDKKKDTFFYPNNVVHAVDVAVSNVDPYGPERKTVFLPRTMDGDGRAQHIDSWTEVAAGRWVAGRRVGGEGVRRHWAGKWREAAMLLNWMQADSKILY